MKNYIPLHVHTHYSLLDGLSKPKDIVDRCQNIGVKSCAITDHGSISGTVQFYSELKKNNIKPILGCELYISQLDSKEKNKSNSKLDHLVVLAKNLKGWKTLIKIVSESNNPDRYYHKPRIDIDALGDLLDGNIVAITGHLGSTLARQIMPDNTNKICDEWKKKGEDHISKLTNAFGTGNVFLEAQLIDKQINPAQIELTDCIRSLGNLMNTKVICTPDAHYAKQSDAVDQRILLCNNMKTTLSQINYKLQSGHPIPLSCFFNSDKYYIPSPEEMSKLHSEEEIENTIYVDSLCEDYDILSQPILPPFNYPKKYESDSDYLRDLCRAGWKNHKLNKLTKEEQDQYVKRLKYEFDVLHGANLSSYFLIVQDIVNHIRESKWLPGPGRGSAAGCLVSYLLGITSIDPMKYDLLFDRFYNAGRNTKDRVSMPDIDIDVPIDKRESIIEYIKKTYGENKVSQMLTFNTMKGRGALKDVLRAYGNLSFEDMNKITKNIPDEAKISDELQEMKKEYGEASIIKWALENKSKDLKEWCSIDSDGSLNGPLSKRFEQAIRLEGTKTNQSKHAAGVVIAPEILTNICPMVYDTKNKNLIAGMEMQDLESIGVIKFDILGVAVLDKIMNISDMLKEGV
jgi:DNA polymerase-3 subunit alpha